MNCENCGAPLRPVPNRNHLFCEHCETFRFPTPMDKSSDRLVAQGVPGDRKCPRCDRLLAMGKLDGVEVRYCRKCRGFLVESEAFGLVVRQRRSDFKGAERLPTPLDPRQLQRTISCPVCQERMEVHPYYGPGNVVIDSCRRCRLIWCDHGEMAAIESAPGKR